MTPTLIIVLIIAIALSILFVWLAARKAPAGWQDETKFHEGKPENDEVYW